MGRLKREKDTIEIMIKLYCKLNHRNKGLCRNCSNLLNFAFERIDKCPYGIEDKPTCDHCPTHCYPKKEREKIKEIMRFSGPRMMFKHPYLTIMHFVDRRKEIPDLKNKI